MQKPAPKGIKPVIVDQIGHQTGQKIAEQLTKGGYPSTPQSVLADQTPVLSGMEKFGGEVLHDARDYIGTTLEELGGGGATLIRETHAREPLSMGSMRRYLKDKLSRKKAA